MKYIRKYVSKQCDRDKHNTIINYQYEYINVYIV